MNYLTGNYKYVQEGVFFKNLVLYVEHERRVPFSTHDKWLTEKAYRKASVEDYLQLVKDGVLK